MDVIASEEKSMLKDSSGTDVKMRDLEKNTTPNSNYPHKVYMVVGTLVVIGIALCILGGMFVSRSNLQKRSKEDDGCRGEVAQVSICAYSAEAKRVKLPELLLLVKSAYFKLNPNVVLWERDVDDEEMVKIVKERFLPYETHPLKLKEKTDKSLELLSQFKSQIVDIDIDKLKARELKAFEQLKHFLQHNFGIPYDEHYYNGDWMMGPNIFCWQPFCDIHRQLYIYSLYVVPSSHKDLEKVIDRILKHKAIIDRYRSNIQLGVKTGMVRSIEDCRSGADAIKEKFKLISRTNNSESVLNEEFTGFFQFEEFFQLFSSEDKKLWLIKKNKTVLESVQDALIKGFGQPILDLINYLDHDHLRHCIPSHVSSGLVSLPVDFVYYDGKATTERTTKLLPTGEVLNGKESYSRILSYFTTTNNNAEEIYEKGEDQKALFYEEILRIAKLITNSESITTAVKRLKELLHQDSQWHNQEKFPENESNANAFKTCIDVESAKRFCPVRYAALEKWTASSREIMARIHPQFTNAFHVTGSRVTLPSCPIEIYPHFNPSVGTMSFEESDEPCSEPTRFRLPFFLKRFGPKFQQWSVVAHETRPGHHTQSQGAREHFHSHCKGLVTWLEEQNSFSAFTEGWALYSENPVMSDDTDIYEEDQMQKYGMLKWQLWRALRLIIDTGLHHRGIKRDEALRILEIYAWDNTDFAVKEVTRYQSCPGQATAYMIGRLTILELRRKAEQELGDKFNLKDFHYQVLSQGNAPLSFLRTYIGKYIECVKNDVGSSLCKSIVESEKEWDEFSGGHVKRTSTRGLEQQKRHYP